MGILDDAIREHLELRRRNGADGEEVTRLEHSLLSDGEEAVAAEPTAETAAPQAAEPVAPEPDPVPEPEAAAAAEATPAEPDPPFELAPLEQPTRQFTAAEVEAAEEPHAAAPASPDAAAPGEHDELEDTPDFLQETPEHERLWFEQKPPKDFDF